MSQHCHQDSTGSLSLEVVRPGLAIQVTAALGSGGSTMMVLAWRRAADHTTPRHP
ncbi:hypothetical protein Micbo1qcDRAFT_156929, partial [Microdochium bolleyi]